MTRFFLRHPVTTWMIFTAFMVTGVYALPKLKVEAIPEVDLPTLTIQTRWNGASPQAIHRAITIPVEEAASNVHGVEKITSTSRAGDSRVEVSFRRGVDIEFAREGRSFTNIAGRHNTFASLCFRDICAVNSS